MPVPFKLLTNKRAKLTVKWYESEGLVARVGLGQLRKASALDIIILAASRCGTERNTNVIAL